MVFKIGFVQFAPRRYSIEDNIAKLDHLISGVEADLLVLPELSNSGYVYTSPNALRPFAEPANGSGPFINALRQMAGKIRGAIVAGYAEADGDKLFNSAIAVSETDILTNYRKTHLYADEKLLFKPGDTGFEPFIWRSIKIGIMVCFDWIFPESARTLALKGAQVLAHPANLVLPYCQDAMITRSIENQIFTITANRIGPEESGAKSLVFTGGSQITTPKGQRLFMAPKDKACVHLVKINPEDARNKYISTRNDLFEDRREDVYQS